MVYNLSSSLFRRLIFWQHRGSPGESIHSASDFPTERGEDPDPQLYDLEKYLEKFQETMLATVDESINRVLSGLATRFPLLAQQHAQAIQQPSPQQMELEALPSRLRKPVKITGFPVRRPWEIRERQVRKQHFYHNTTLILLSLKSVSAESY